MSTSSKSSLNQLSTIGSKKTSLKTSMRDSAEAGKQRVGSILCKEGHITSGQLQEALEYQKKHAGRLGSILLKMGYIEEETIVNVLSRMYNYPPIMIAKTTPEKDALNLIPYDLAKKYLAFPLRISGQALEVTMAEPTDTSAIEELQLTTQKNIQAYVSTEKDIVEAYKQYYGIADDEYQSFFDLKEEEEEDQVNQIDDFGSLVSEVAGDMELETAHEDDVKDIMNANDAPIIKLVNGILIRAVNEGVSDIHIEPFEKSLQVRYRMDGALYKSMNLPLNIKNALISRIKIISGLDISERRVPQDGRIKLKIGKRRAIDFRVSTLPTLFGEGVVMRILDPSALNVDLTKIGFEPDTFEALKRCIFRPYGLLLVTGPTGSGKTTTLYSILNQLNREDTKILTAEDPVEFNFKGINQVLVRNEVGMTFAAALKAFLRQDPDIIMVGEIRDIETAEIAIKAAMTGHLVFSTLHTNDCPSTIGRMADIGIPYYMLASAVSMVLSQRLARRLCPHCKTPVENSVPAELISMGFRDDEIEGLKLFSPNGCSKCTGGYRGRIGLYELMEVTDDLSKAINAGLGEDQLRKTAIHEGMITLRQAGLQKARKGETSIEEVLRRTTITEEALPEYLVNPDVERYQDRDVIIREGNNDKDFFKLVQGQVLVAKGGRQIAEISEPGEYFGEMAAIAGEPRSASIIAKNNAVVKRFPGDKLMELVEEYPDVAKHLFGTLVKRLGQANMLTLKLAQEVQRKK